MVAFILTSAHCIAWSSEAYGIITSVLLQWIGRLWRSPVLQRPGAFAMYLEPWHADVFEFLDLKKNTGKEEQRARDLFYALWIPDLFMKRVEENGSWSLMCPNECPGLADCWGEDFEELYTR